MAVLTVTPVTRAGVDVAGVAADVAGDEWANTGKEIVEVKNGSGVSITVTLDVKATLDGNAVTDPTVTITAGQTKAIGPFPRGVFNDANDRAKITYSAVTSVTTKVLQVTPA